MKKNDTFFALGKRRAWETAEPVHGGTIVGTTKDGYMVLWDGSNAPIEISKEKFELVGKHKEKDREKELFKLRKEING